MSIRVLASGTLLFAFLSAGAAAGDPAAASLDDLLDAGRRLSPSLRAAALDSAAMAAKAEGADALDDPMIADNYQYFRDPGVFSGHAITLTQAFPLWGKRDLRREAALADLAAARGRERAAKDELDERIKAAFARYVIAGQAAEVGRSSIDLIETMSRSAGARYGAGRGDQGAVLQWINEATAARAELIRYEADRQAAQALLNALVLRPAETALGESGSPRPLPDLPAVSELVERARGDSPALASGAAEIAAAQNRRSLADKAWYPDVTVGAGPVLQTNNRSVGVAATVGLTIPLGWGREESEQKAASAAVGAAEARYQASLVDIAAALGEAAARLSSAKRTIALLEGQALPEAQAAVNSVLADYTQGRGDLAGVLAALHRLHDLKLKMLEARLDGQISLAAIERLLGGEL